MPNTYELTYAINKARDAVIKQAERLAVHYAISARVLLSEEQGRTK